MENLHVRVRARDDSGHRVGRTERDRDRIGVEIGRDVATGPSRTNGAADRGRLDRTAPVMGNKPQEGGRW